MTEIPMTPEKWQQMAEDENAHNERRQTPWEKIGEASVNDHGDPIPAVMEKIVDKFAPTEGSYKHTCGVEDCGRTHHAKGWCLSHYNHWKTQGHPTIKPNGDRRIKKNILINTIDREELAWAGGFFCGEGTFNSEEKENYYYPRLRVPQSFRTEELERFQRAIGGLGSISGPHKTSHSDELTSYCLVVNGFEGVQAVAAMLWPWLTSIKQEQASQTLLRTRGKADGR